MKHKHAELIKQWADGAEIEWVGATKYDGTKLWSVVANPTWNESHEYRIKPEPKPDVVLYGTFFPDVDGEGEISLTIDRFNTDQFKFVFDGETLNPKSVEVLP